MSIVYGADFGHTTPFFTFPIGGEVLVNAEHDRVEIMLM